MKIKGAKIHREQVEIEISAWELLNKLCDEICKKLVPKTLPSHDQIYIGPNNYWIGWDNSHGSGDTTVYWEASDSEIIKFKILSDFKLMAKRELEETNV